MPKSRAGGLAMTYLIAAIAALSGLLFGFDIAVINGALIFLRKDFHLSDLQTEVATSALLLGCIVGAMIGGWFSDHFGRRRTLRWSAIFFAASSLGASFAHSILAFDLARIVGGIAIGVASMLAPLYIAEMSPAQIRGRLVSFNQLAIVIGILLAYGINWALSFSGMGWRWMFAVAALPSALLFLGLFFVPESPRWLIEKKRLEEARGVLTQMEEPCKVEAVFAEIEQSTLSGQAPLSDLFRAELRKPLVLAVGIAILQQLTGINTVLFYGSLIFEQTIFPHRASAALAANVTLGIINLLGTMASLMIIDRIGRKPLIMTSAALMGICELGLAVGFRHGHVTLILASMLLCVGAFAVGMGPGPWVLLAEVFPTRLRGRAMSLANVSLWMASLLLTATFLSLVRAVTLSGAFCVYAVLCVVTVIFMARVAPETSGLTLEEVERLWGVEQVHDSESVSDTM